ncbi:MAG: hypothetical protein K2Y21_15925 [Phycisphaerales bacterium]|nr:hypothetical protein [Phycisphaerales bacterium]
MPNSYTAASLACLATLTIGHARAADPAPAPSAAPASAPTTTQTPVPTTVQSEVVPGGNVKVLPDQPILGFADADALLTALETADANLTTLTADIKYVRDFAIAGDTQTRTGTLWFTDSRKASDKSAPASRRFSIQFKDFQVGGRLENRDQFYIFDGEWLVEKFPGEKRMIKRQVVRPGEKFDPLKIGEGPLPIPIGQKRVDILARYDATLLPADDGFDDMPLETAKRLRSFTTDCVQLMLVPRPELSGRDAFKAIRLWYKPADTKAGKRLLPRLAHTINTADDESTVYLLNIKTNEEAKLDSVAFDTASPKDWDVIIQPFRGGIEDAGTAQVPEAGPDIKPAGTDRAPGVGEAPKKPK